MATTTFFSTYYAYQGTWVEADFNTTGAYFYSLNESVYRIVLPIKIIPTSGHTVNSITLNLPIRLSRDSYTTQVSAYLVQAPSSITFSGFTSDNNISGVKIAPTTYVSHFDSAETSRSETPTITTLTFDNLSIKQETNFYVWIYSNAYVHWFQSSATCGNASISIIEKADGLVRIKTSSGWKTAIPYVKVSGAWKQAIPYVKSSGIWKISS